MNYPRHFWICPKGGIVKVNPGSIVVIATRIYVLENDLLMEYVAWAKILLKEVKRRVL